MRNIVIVRHGPPEVLETREAPDPAPGDGEIRIAVRAAGVNFADVLARLALSFKRRGEQLRLRHAPPELVELIEFMGLAEVLRVEPGR